MNRGEMAVTVLGLLGTFLLPWPGEGGRVETAVRKVAAPMQAVSRTNESQRCAGKPLRQQAAPVSRG
jgi:hypothetical protein